MSSEAPTPTHPRPPVSPFARQGARSSDTRTTTYLTWLVLLARDCPFYFTTNTRRKCQVPRSVILYEACIRAITQRAIHTPTLFREQRTCGRCGIGLRSPVPDLHKNSRDDDCVCIPMPGQRNDRNVFAPGASARRRPRATGHRQPAVTGASSRYGRLALLPPISP